MTKDRDFKRLARRRMAKTGEAYTTARARLLARRPPAEPAELAALAGMRDAAVEAKTGRDWAAWVGELDAWGAREREHREIAAHLAESHGLSGWWAQTVTVGYERIVGLREIGQRRDGTFEASKSKTVAAPLGELVRACRDVRWRRRWLPEPADPVVRKATRDRSLRIAWPDGTSVELWFTAAGTRKSRVQVQHRKLASRTEAERMKAFWGERLEALAELLAGAD